MFPGFGLCGFRAVGAGTWVLTNGITQEQIGKVMV